MCPSLKFSQMMPLCLIIVHYQNQSPWLIIIYWTTDVTQMSAEKIQLNITTVHLQCPRLPSQVSASSQGLFMVRHHPLMLPLLSQPSKHTSLLCMFCGSFYHCLEVSASTTSLPNSFKYNFASSSKFRSSLDLFL